MLRWVPYSKFLSHSLHKTYKIFSTFAPGPGFFSTPITNSTVKVIAHRIIVPKQNNTCPFPCAVRHVVLVLRSFLTMRLLFTTGTWLHYQILGAWLPWWHLMICWSLEWNFLQCHPSCVLIAWKICAPLVWLYIITRGIYYYFMFTAVSV